MALAVLVLVLVLVPVLVLMVGPKPILVLELALVGTSQSASVAVASSSRSNNSSAAKTLGSLVTPCRLRVLALPASRRWPNPTLSPVTQVCSIVRSTQRSTALKIIAACSMQ